MADVAQMSLKEPDQIDFSNYQDGGGGNFAPPDEGKYFGKAPIITDESFSSTQEGYLKVTIDPIEVTGLGREYKIRFTNLSAKKYQNRNGSQVLDFLRACGIAAAASTNDQLKAALKMASGRPFQFGLVWEAYNKDTKESLKGQASFPDDPQNPGKKQTWIPDPFDEKKKIFANGKVRYFISAVGGK